MMVNNVILQRTITWTDSCRNGVSLQGNYITIKYNDETDVMETMENESQIVLSQPDEIAVLKSFDAIRNILEKKLK